MPEKEKVAFESQNITFKSILSSGTEIARVFMILLDYFEETWLADKCSGRFWTQKRGVDWRQTWMQRNLSADVSSVSLAVLFIAFSRGSFDRSVYVLFLFLT